VQCGFCYRYWYFEDDKVVFEVNQGFSNLFARYIRILAEKRYHISLGYFVTSYSVSFYFDNADSESKTLVEKVHSCIFNEDVDEELFAMAKDESIAEFKDFYEDLNCRAIYKMFEILHHRKAFDCEKFARDLKNIAIDEFTDLFSKFIYPKNAELFILVSANIYDDFSSIDLRHRTQTFRKLFPAYMDYDILMESDMHLIKPDIEDSNTECLKLYFMNNTVSTEEKYYLLKVVAETVIGEDYYITFDVVEAGIVYHCSYPKEYKYMIERLLTKENVDKAIEKIKSTIVNFMKYGPFGFMTEWADMVVNGVAFEKYQSILSEYAYEKFIELYRTANLFVVESLIAQRKIMVNKSDNENGGDQK
jgi:hypothetical protein